MSSDQIQALKEEIWRRAREKAHEILRDAEAEAKRIIDGAKKRAEEALKDRLEPEKLIIRRRVLGRAVSEGRRLLILSKNELIEKAFQKAIEKLEEDANSKSEAYRNFLIKVLDRTLSLFSDSDEDLIIYANRSDMPFLKERIKQISNPLASRIRFEEAEIMGGIIASEADGRRVYYGTIEGLIEALKPTLREKVAAILFREVGKI
ncbi:MAG: hypothetical protein DRN49_05670 [Thaumarchaeota archaeon]|nr:MAG: hypothetical protein DRN49_05670 [Nitrososphaerota archaeon]